MEANVPVIGDIPSTDLHRRTVAGVSLTAVSQVITQSLIWAVSIVLARLLGPGAYGLVGMTAVFTGFATMFSTMGLGEAIVQRKRLEHRHLASAFWVNVLVGSLVTILMFTVAPAIAAFYGEPRLSPLSRALSFQFFLSSLTVVQHALIRRQMRFRELARVQIASTVVAGIVGLGMAVSGMGVWSLVGQMLGGSTVRLFLLWRVSPWRPSWTFDRQASADLFGFSAYVLAFNAVNYWARNADNLLVGRLLGAVPLGIYSRAYSFMLLPLNQVSNVVTSVMGPALSSIQHDKQKVKRSYVRAIRLLGLVTFPMMIGAFVTAEHLILALLGAKWAGVIPLFRILCGVGLLQSIGTTVGWIYQSQARTDLQFKMGLITAPVCVVAFVIGVRWGVTGVAWAYCIFSLLIWFPNWTVCGSLINLRFGEMIRALVPAFACAVAMGVVVWSVGHVFPRDWPHWLRLIVQMAVGSTVYLILVMATKIEAWREARIALIPAFEAVYRRVGGAFPTRFGGNRQ